MNEDVHGLMDRLKSLSLTDDQQDVVQKVVHHLQRQSVNLADVMQGLSHMALSKAPADRRTCLSLLHQILEQAPLTAISPDEVDVVCDFACQRLKHESDQMSLLLRILHTISRRPTLSDHSVVQMMRTFGQEISIPTQRIEDRFLVYQMMRQMLDKNISALTSDPMSFLLNFVQVIDGERDPRCLILSFRLFTDFVSRMDLGHLSEEMFESIAVYFPVAYNAPSNDPYAISRSDLSSALLSCLKASRTFGPMFYQMVGEKVTSDRRESKLDCYTAIYQCAQTFGSEALMPYMSILWTCIRTDCVKANDSEDDVKTAARSALSAIILTMDEDASGQQQLLQEFEEDMRPALTKQDLGLRQSAMRLVMTAASASKQSFKFLEQHLLPHLMTSLAFDSSRINRMEVHDLIIQFFGQETRSFVKDEGLRNTSLIFSLCMQSEDEPELMSRKWQLLLNLVMGHVVLKPEEEETLIKFVSEVTLDSGKNLHVLHAHILTELLHQKRIDVWDSLLRMISSPDHPVERMMVLLKDVNIPQEKMPAFLEAGVDRGSEELLSLIASKVKDKQSVILDQALKTNNKSVQCILIPHLDSSHASKFMAKVCEKNKSAGDETGISLKSFTSLVSALNVRVSLRDWEVADLIGRWILTSANEPLVHKIMCQVTAKCLEDETRDMIIDLVIQKNDLPAAAHVTKGLLYAGKDFSKTLKLVINSLSTSQSDDAANAFILMHEADPSLESFVTPFLHQKLFFSSLPDLTSLLNSSSLTKEQTGSVKKAILSQLQFLPKNLIHSDLKPVHSLIIDCLSGQESGKEGCVALQCLQHLLTHESVTSLISSNLNSILNSLCRLARDSCLNDRRSSLKCLSLIVTFVKSEEKLLPHRKRVLRHLNDCLADKKRIVRYAASEAVMKWTLLGQPGNEGED